MIRVQETQPPQTFRGGVRWGMMNLTWPFATMELRGEQLFLRFLGRSKVFHRSEITRITPAGSFSKGYRFRHQKRGYPSPVIFWAFQAAKVSAALDQWMAAGATPLQSTPHEAPPQRPEAP